ncbi:MAG TPA: ATP-dependent Clp protease ATP-binding subunit [Armatimonadota bacterium]|nr:ATP-dependent Clp protease ATP-binding subunit [Armatimonadota bacterium]
MAKKKDPAENLTPGAQLLIYTAIRKCFEFQHPHLAVRHWLLSLIELDALLAEELAIDLSAIEVHKQICEKLKEGDCGPVVDELEMIEKAWHYANSRKSSKVTERDLACAIIETSEFRLKCSSDTSCEAVNIRRKPQRSSNEEKPVTEVPSNQTRVNKTFPILSQFGSDFTKRAQEGKLSPVVGREREIELVIETLCRRTKRNPALVGPAGVGKTAIVEGLAHRIVQGDVPDSLKGVQLFAVQPSSLVAGASVWGELEKRMQGLLEEASQDGVIIFIDEMHSIVGAGGATGTRDLASLLKPALARGDIACIAATTDDEYRRFIEPDAALERRFQPVRVQEMTLDETMTVLLSLRDEFVKLQGIEVSDDVLKWLLQFADDYMRNRYFPDKAVDLLEQCVAYAITIGHKKVTRSDAETIAERMVGMPCSLDLALQKLQEQLTDRAILPESDITALVKRLNVSMRELDIRAETPDAVVLLLGEVSGSCQVLAETIAESLYGSASRVVTIDFSRFTEPEHLTMLIGAPPGYVGYTDALPLHRVAQMPWCVLCCENIDACHKSVRNVLMQAVATGVLTDAQGKRIFLSDTVMLLTAHIGIETNQSLGFRRPDETSQSDIRELAERQLGEDIVSHIDLICTDLLSSDVAQRRWLEQHLLRGMTDRYKKYGVSLNWDKSIIDWILDAESGKATQRDWERLVDDHISPLIIQHLPLPGEAHSRSLTIRYQGKSVEILRNEEVEPVDGKNAATGN